MSAPATPSRPRPVRSGAHGPLLPSRSGVRRAARRRRARLVRRRPACSPRTLRGASDRDQPSVHDLRRPPGRDARRRRPYPRPRPRPAAGSVELAAGHRGLASFERTASSASQLDEAATKAGVTLESLGALIAHDPPTHSGCSPDGASLPETDRLAQLTRAAWNQGAVLRVPAGVSCASPSHLRWAVGARGPRRSSPGRSSSSGRARRPRWSRCSSRPPRRPPAASRCSPAPPRSSSARGQARVASVQELPGRHRRVPASGRARSATGAPAPLGARPGRRPARPQPRRQPARGRPLVGRAGRDRLRRRRAALRPDVLHDPHRP